jgi:unsaturated rhamnogalacturonyl hydrolase
LLFSENYYSFSHLAFKNNQYPLSVTKGELMYRISLCSSNLVIFCGLLLAITLYIQPLPAQDTVVVKKKLNTIIDGILHNSTFRFIDKQSGKQYVSTADAPAEAQLQPESPYNDWRYWNGVLNLAFIQLGESWNKPEYIGFVEKNIAFCFDSYPYFEQRYKNEGKWIYPFGQFFMMEELDDCGAMGGSVIEINSRQPQDRYRLYIEKAADHILNRQQRLEDGTLVRSFPVRWTLWADDLYMGLSFLARIAETTGDRKYYDDAARQVADFHKYLFDEQMGLMHHCWYSDNRQPGVAYWGRANGWAMLAQVELLDRLPADHPRRNELINLLQRHVLGIARYQGGEGLWHQLLDKSDSYLETSCTAMFTYAIARAVNKGYIAPRYASIALNGWMGVQSRIRDDGQIEGICAGTGTADDLIHYYHRPTPLNDIHGIGAVLLAGCEVLRLLPNLSR